MDAQGLYLAITRYMHKRGWNQTPIYGTFCSGKASVQYTCFCVSACVGNCTNETYLNVIVNEKNGGNEIHSITLGVLTGETFEKRKESYRVDYNQTNGWHIDSSRVKHKKLKHLKGYGDYEKAIDLINSYGSTLPYVVENNLY
jgi:hypothetical protein